MVAQARGVAMEMTGVVHEDSCQSTPYIAEHYAKDFLASYMVMALVDKHQRGLVKRLIFFGRIPFNLALKVHRLVLKNRLQNGGGRICNYYCGIERFHKNK